MKEIQLYNYIVERQLEKNKPVRTGELAKATGAKPATLHRMLKVLMDECMIYRIKRGSYVVSSEWLTSSLMDVHRAYDTVEWIRVL